MEKVKFTAMKDGDAEDYAFLTRHEIAYAAETGQRLLDALVKLAQTRRELERSRNCGWLYRKQANHSARVRYYRF